MTTEVWKPVPGWPYNVSSLGRVMRTTFGHATAPGKILKGTVRKVGYRYMTLCDPGPPAKKLQVRLSVLMMRVFRGPANGREVNHIDTVKTHDVLRNLEYLTHPEHEKHSVKMGLKASAANGRHASVKDPQFGAKISAAFDIKGSRRKISIALKRYKRRIANETTQDVN